MGRSDFQVKVRGFRVELGEIDTVLSGHSTVEFAATLGRETPSGTTVLVAYVLPVPGGTTVDPAELTKFVSRTLPSHMVPSTVIVLDTVPLTAVGKLDRDALPTPVFEATESRSAETYVEQVIAEVFAEVLGGLDRVGVEDSFFALGGDSIVSIQLVSRAKAAGGRVHATGCVRTQECFGPCRGRDTSRGGRRRDPRGTARWRCWFASDDATDAVVRRFDSRLRALLAVAFRETARGYRSCSPEHHAPGSGRSPRRAACTRLPERRGRVDLRDARRGSGRCRSASPARPGRRTYDGIGSYRTRFRGVGRCPRKTRYGVWCDGPVRLFDFEPRTTAAAGRVCC